VLGAAVLVAAATDLLLWTKAPGKVPEPAGSLSRAAS
jgi:hypothetical protein